MSKTVLVTGAHGFLGRNVARCFAREGWTVTGIGHGGWDRAESQRHGLTFWHVCDITQESLVTYAGEPDVIVHCAGSGSVAFSMLHPHQDFSRTVSATASVLDYVRVHSPATSVVYPSSAAVYGAAARLPICEGDPLRPASPYGVHKVMAEDLCRSYGRHFGVSTAIVRFFSVFGEGLQKQLLWDACSKAERGDATFFGTGEEFRDWLYVDDAARLICAASAHASAGAPVVNGASGIRLTVREVLAEVFRAYGSPLALEFSGTQRPGDPVGYHADMAASQQWGWTASVGWREGVARYVSWFKGRRS